MEVHPNGVEELSLPEHAEWKSANDALSAFRTEDLPRREL